MNTNEYANKLLEATNKEIEVYERLEKAGTLEKFLNMSVAEAEKILTEDGRHARSYCIDEENYDKLKNNVVKVTAEFLRQIEIIAAKIVMVRDSGPSTYKLFKQQLEVIEKNNLPTGQKFRDFCKAYEEDHKQ